MNNPNQQTNIFEAVPVSPDPFVKPKVKRVNSTSTIYAKSTIGKPDISEIVEWYDGLQFQVSLQSMAVTIFWQIKQSELQLDTGFNEIFSVQNKVCLASDPYLSCRMLLFLPLQLLRISSKKCGRVSR